MRILFVGNSHSFFNDMPHSFALLWKAAVGESTCPTLLCHPGMGFDYHLKEYFEVRYNLLYGEYDYAVFQQRAHPFAGTEQDLADGARLAELARKGGAQPVFCLTWAEQRAPEHQAEMNDFHRRLCAETGALLSPVGLVWQQALALSPALPLYFADGEHASPYGDHLIALTHACFLSGKRAAGLPEPGLDFFDPVSRAIREDVAACAVPLEPQHCAVIRQAVDAVLYPTLPEGGQA